MAQGPGEWGLVGRATMEHSPPVLLFCSADRHVLEGCSGRGHNCCSRILVAAHAVGLGATWSACTQVHKLKPGRACSLMGPWSCLELGGC